MFLSTAIFKVRKQFLGFFSQFVPKFSSKLPRDKTQINENLSSLSAFSFVEAVICAFLGIIFICFVGF